MRSLRIFVYLAASTIFSFAMAADSLHRREVNIKNPGGKDFIMAFEELQRDEKTSLAKVTHTSGASVASSMFIARGFYDLARLRGAAYFIKLKEWRADDGGWMYLVGFANDKNTPIREYFNLTEQNAATADREFDSVSNYDLIFGPRK